MLWTGWLLFVVIALWIAPPVCWFVSRRLRAPEDLDNSQLPVVTIIVPACNEEAAIEQALRSMLDSDYPNLQVVAVNDRSTDRTGELMDRVAANDNRCRVVHISELPEGWLGKNHAMHMAAAAADGEYLLFTDGDVIYEPGAIAAAVRYMQQQNLQHLCLLPRMIPGHFFENCMVSFFGLAFAIGQQVHLIRTPLPFAYAGVGAFNLIQTNCYRSFGGHKKIAMDVIDDAKLGKLVKQHGGRQDFLAAPDFLSLRWYPSLPAAIKGLEKNGFAALGYSLLAVLACTILFFVTMISPYVVPFFTSPTDATGFLATAVLWHCMYGITIAAFGGNLLMTFFFPISALLLSIAFWNSAWVTLRQGGVRWRTTTYSLAMLRRGIYQ